MTNKVKGTTGNSKIIYLLFFIFPFVTFILSIVKNKERWAKSIFVLFLIFYGFNFVVLDKSYDSYYYKEQFDYLRHYFLIDGTFNLSNTSYAYTGFDFLQPLISFSVGIFTGDSRFLFATFAAVFGFFYASNIWYTLSRTERPLTLYSWIIFLVLLLLIPIWFINGIRMWTAAHMFIFGLLPYLYENRKNKLIFCFLSIFMHFSFLIPLIVLVVFLFFKPSLRIVFALFILSVFVNEINIEAIKSLTSPFLPDFASDRFDLYTSDSHLEKNKEISSSGNFFVNLVSTSFKIAYYLLVLILFYSYFKSESYFKEYECPISFTFTLGIVCNIIFSIPSMGRFMTIHYFLFFGILLILLSKSLIFRGANKFLLICMPFLLMFTIQSLRSGFDTISFITVFGNPIINVFTDEMYPIINFIK